MRKDAHDLLQGNGVGSSAPSEHPSVGNNLVNTRGKYFMCNASTELRSVNSAKLRSLQVLATVNRSHLWRAVMLAAAEEPKRDLARCFLDCKISRRSPRNQSS